MFASGDALGRRTLIDSSRVFADRIQSCGRIVFDIRSPHAHHPIATALQILRTFPVISHRSARMTAIDFNHERSLGAHQVEHERPDCVLATKFKSAEAGMRKTACEQQLREARCISIVAGLRIHCNHRVISETQRSPAHDPIRSGTRSIRHSSKPAKCCNTFPLNLKASAAPRGSRRTKSR